MKYRLAGLFFLLSLVFLFSGCQKVGEKNQLVPGNREYKIYYLENEENEIVAQDYRPQAKDNDRKGLVKEFLEKLSEIPDNLNCKKAKPDDVHILSSQLQDDKLSLYFNEAYNNVTGISEVLMRAAIVKTLCQIDGVDAVEFYVDGQPLMETPEKAVGFMKGDSFIDNTGGETNFFQYAELTLYFAGKDGAVLKPVTVSIRYDGTIALEQLIVEQLIKGPESIKGVDKKNILATVPGTTVLNKISVKDGTCFVDFNEEFFNKSSEISDEAVIYSVVNSLSELSGIDRIEFLINGEKQATYREKFPFDESFERNLDLVEE